MRLVLGEKDLNLGDTSLAYSLLSGALQTNRVAKLGEIVPTILEFTRAFVPEFILAGSEVGSLSLPGTDEEGPL